MDLPIKDRATAGRALAESLVDYADGEAVLVLALPRGGVPVAYEVARGIGARLDLMLVRKLGSPTHEELAMGAIASGGVRVLNEDVIAGLNISAAAIDAAAVREQRELERRERAYRDGRPLPQIEGNSVILVDDGIATGATIRAAIAALRQRQPARVVVAVPVAPAGTLQTLGRESDEVACLATPDHFGAIGNWYRSFPQVSDSEVRELLLRRWSQED